MKGVIIVSSNGSIIPATYTGTYTVNSNCTGVKSATLSIGAVVDFFFVIDDDFGNRFKWWLRRLAFLVALPMALL